MPTKPRRWTAQGRVENGLVECANFGLESASDRFEDYEPLKISRLFAIFAEETPSTAEGMQAFCNKFGLLGGGRPDLALSRGKPTYEAVVLDLLLEQHREFRRAVEFYRQNDLDAELLEFTPLAGHSSDSTSCWAGRQDRDGFRATRLDPGDMAAIRLRHVRRCQTLQLRTLRHPVRSWHWHGSAQHIEILLKRLQGCDFQKEASKPMRGHIRERSPGHWAIVLDIRDLETGERKRKWHSFVGTKREARSSVPVS